MSLATLAATPKSFATAQGAPSQGGVHDVGLALRFGSVGASLEASKLLVSHVGARVGVNYFTYNDNGQSLGDNTVDLKLQLHSFSALLDLYPGARRAFHFTVGLLTAPAKLTGASAPGSSTFTINDHDYTASQVGTLTPEITFPSAEPYVGLGFGTAAAKHRGLGFVFDLGVGIGKPTLHMTSTGAANNAVLQADLNNEVIKRQSDANKLFGWPVVSLGLMYRF